MATDPPGAPVANPSRDGAHLRHQGPVPTSLRATGEAKDMTLDELAAFIEDASKAGIPGDRNIRAELSYSGKIKEVEIVLSEDDD